LIQTYPTCPKEDQLLFDLDNKSSPFNCKLYGGFAKIKPTDSSQYFSKAQYNRPDIYYLS
jgi:hypothetical protein